MFEYLHPSQLFIVIPFLVGWLADRLLGDPKGWFHPVVLFGKWIGNGEEQWNHGNDRLRRGAVMSLSLILGVFILTTLILYASLLITPFLTSLLTAVGVFYCLSGETLIKEVKATFAAVNRSTEEGRKQVARIVGRDTSGLSNQEIRTAGLETLSENLSDGVISPMFWFLIFGLPGMLAYKMINTLDSMIGYRNERYQLFGCWAARIDDIANYIPARITAFFMLLVMGKLNRIGFVLHYGSKHASPNSGYPESALAAILDCQFGGTHIYFGDTVVKPYIGTNGRDFNDDDLRKAVTANNRTELLMGLIVVIILLTQGYIV